jgi:hypothetical protein
MYTSQVLVWGSTVDMDVAGQRFFANYAAAVVICNGGGDVATF